MLMKRPPATELQGAYAVVGLEVWLAADVAVHDLAEQLPGFALELLQLDLRDRSEVGRAGVDLDARQQAAEFEILDAGRLLHDVLTRQVVAACLEDVNESLGSGIAEHHAAIDPVGFWIVLRQKFVE